MLGKGLCPVRNCVSQMTVCNGESFSQLEIRIQDKIFQDFYVSLILVFNDRKPSIVDVLVPPMCITAQALHNEESSRSILAIRVRLNNTRS